MTNISPGDLAIDDPDLIKEMMKEEETVFKNRGPRPGHTTRYIGAPESFVRDVCRLTEGRSALVVALCIYRRTIVTGHRTVTLPTAELGPLDVDWRRKHEALAKLKAADLIKVESSRGRTARITLLWRPGSLPR